MHAVSHSRYGGPTAGPSKHNKQMPKNEQLPAQIIAKLCENVANVESYKSRPVSYNKVFKGIFLANGETVCDIELLKSLGVTHILNSAEDHVQVSPTKLAIHGIRYHGFHVDDLPECDISRYFISTTDYIHSAVSSGGLVLVNCYMGLSRSATCVLAYLITKHNMSLTKALDVVRASRAVRPNDGFLKQLEVLQMRLAGRSC